jgi:hypothetical protein
MALEIIAGLVTGAKIVKFAAIVSKGAGRKACRRHFKHELANGSVHIRTEYDKDKAHRAAKELFIGKTKLQLVRGLGNLKSIQVIGLPRVLIKMSFTIFLNILRLLSRELRKLDLMNCLSTFSMLALNFCFRISLR